MSSASWASLRQTFRLATEGRPTACETLAPVKGGGNEKGKASNEKLAALIIAAYATMRGTGILQ